MRYNLSGLVGCVLALLGVVSYTVWLVALAEDSTRWILLTGLLAAALISLGAGVLYATVRRSVHSPRVGLPHWDPVEPELTRGQARDYELRYHHRSEAPVVALDARQRRTQDGHGSDAPRLPRGERRLSLRPMALLHGR